jgi:hypothetical protein
MTILDEILAAVHAKRGTLKLDGQNLTELPPQIGQLTSLEILSLSNNKLRKLPAEIGKLSKLRRLYIQENCLSELPAEFARIESLQEVDLHEWLLKHPNCIPRIRRSFMASGNPWVYPPAEIMNRVQVIRG